MIINQNVSGGGAPAKQYDMAVVTTATVLNTDNEFENMFSNQAAQNPNFGPKTVDFGSVTQITGTQNCYGMFDTNDNIQSVDLSNVQEISGVSTCSTMFYACTGISGTIDMGSLTTIGDSNSLDCCNGMFSDCNNITGVDLHSLTTICAYGAGYMFSDSSLTRAITTLDISALTTIDPNGCEGMFSGAVGNISVDLGALTAISQFGCVSMFDSCGIDAVDLHSLREVGSGGGSRMFASCEYLTELDFPALVIASDGAFESICDGCVALERVSFGAIDPSMCGQDPFGDPSFSTAAFAGCNALIEIHFPQGTQADVSQWAGYADKFGATNATIYFDL